MLRSAGTRLGSYEIVTAVGAGGMGEVYRARDTKLQRDVAIKILPPAFAADADRLARFEREAQTLAALNHPHIAQIYGVLEEPAALVMEFADGDDLAARLQRGPLPIEQALTIGRQIADALEAAHDRGIVHRDLKPANIKVAPDRTVKVLDFGLAKAMSPAFDGSGDGGLDLQHSPTFTSPALTQMGVILGTAAYMAPEQARGLPADKRADIWAFGCVLFEMLTGHRAFEGDDTTSVLARIIEREPDLSRLPPATPAPVRRLLRRCFEKKRARRLADVHDAALELDDALAGVEAAIVATGAARAGGTRLPWLVAGALALALAGAVWTIARGPAPARLPPMNYEIQAPRNTSLALAQRPAITISRDGRSIVYTAASEGGTQLYRRQRDKPDAEAIPGTEGATNPVWSPDGRRLAFADGRDMKVTLIGAAPVSIAPIQDFRGVTWLDDGTLVYSPDAGGGLMRVPAEGGTPAALTTVNAAAGERTHRWPWALPGGKAVLFIVGSNTSPDDYNAANVDAVIVATGERRKVFSGASAVAYAPTGHLIFARSGSLYAVRFDPDTLAVSGTPALVLQGVGGDATTGAASFACADDGTLVYAPGATTANGNLRRIVWTDRSGNTEPLDLPPALYNDVRVSPDGTRLAVVVGASGTGDVWIYNVGRRGFTRFTFNANAATPVWSADGRSIYYASVSPVGRTTFYRKPADGSREAESVASMKGRVFLSYVTADGRTAVVDQVTDTNGGLTDVVAVPLSGAGKPAGLVSTPAEEYTPALSPDGRWLAYASNETGSYEVYVRDMSSAGARWQISSTGGEEPHWSADGKELFYRVDTRLMHVAVTTRPEFESGTPQRLLENIYNLRSDTQVSYDVNPKTGRFLMIRSADPTAAEQVSTIRVVLNWFDELRRTVAEAR